MSPVISRALVKMVGVKIIAVVAMLLFFSWQMYQMTLFSVSAISTEADSLKIVEGYFDSVKLIGMTIGTVVGAIAGLNLLQRNAALTKNDVENPKD